MVQFEAAVLLKNNKPPLRRIHLAKEDMYKQYIDQPHLFLPQTNC